MVGAFEALRAEGRIRRWGVSNFRVADMEDLFRVRGGDACAANQVRYSLTDRTIARTRTETRGRPGHEKRPTPAYLVERRVHLLIRNEFPIRDRGPGTLSIGRLVPLRWLLPDEEIMKVLAQRPGIHMVPPEVGHSLR